MASHDRYYLPPKSISPYILYILIASLPGFVIFPLGGAFTISMKSFLSSALGEDHHGRLYAIVAAVETLGSLIGTPIFATIFSKGLRLGGWALGVPYLASAVGDYRDIFHRFINLPSLLTYLLDCYFVLYQRLYESQIQ